MIENNTSNLWQNIKGTKKKYNKKKQKEMQRKDQQYYQDNKERLEKKIARYQCRASSDEEKK